ncbi:Peroxidase 5 [Acorus gramineus]|uniref:Peroxidase n=1 Tax=Acorus gramineus TaxID=55184 RepID=A0AAV9BCI3_ACOGR|nr:Peroxidase 5 [Acorus gramineus]
MGLRGETILSGLLMFLCLSLQSQAQLQKGFYNDTCPLAETIVREEVVKAISKDVGLAAGLIRMFFHDCFVGGCEGSVLIDSTPSNTAEKDSPINNPSLRGFEIIDSAKARLEATCKGVVSCADILAFAARDSVALTGGFGYIVPAGRRDGRVSLLSETFKNLPPPSFNVSQLTQNFANKGFSQEEMVTLSGAHTLGRSHCSSFSNRLYNFSATSATDPSLDPTYAEQLKQQCPNGRSTNASLVVPMDPSTPNFFDSSYYSNILKKRGLFTSDQTLMSNSTTASYVRRNAFLGIVFRNKFAEAMVKMGNIGVLMGTDGEIRLNCRVVN